ncbi:MAG: excinuclease ABC subunit UvrC [Methanosarcinales archaeon]|nr:excinuclease ABC subunit UvrC [Methanosarcinales archaeon]
MKKPDYIPDSPGVYLFKDKVDNIIYVGKSLSLKKRVSQYFMQTDQDTKTRALVNSIANLEYMVTPTEIDALILESNLIKEHRPRYNVNLKDDKQYPFIKITVNEEFPRIFLTRRRVQDSAKYFGPYISAWAIRETLKTISRIFKIRQCKKKIRPGGRTCLNFQIGLCSAPCSGMIDKEEYRNAVKSTIQFLEGKNEILIQRLKDMMQYYASQQKFEAAAGIRDQLQAIELLSRRQQVTGGFSDWDAISIAMSDDIACVQVLYIRDGSLIGHGEYTLDVMDASEQEVMSTFMKQYYRDAPIPTEILVDIMPDDPTIIHWLKSISAGKVEIMIPVRGRKKELVEMASKNACSLLKVTHLKQERIEKTGSGVLIELKDILGLEKVPEYVEGFDISNIGGTDAVGSMVVFANGIPDKQRYRHFNIKNVTGIDDPAMMKEIISRRMKWITDTDDTVPDLIVVDGGAQQMNAALKAIQHSGITVPVIGLAKKLEQIYVPGAHNPLILPDTSPALKLLKQIRDESHRFAISHHRRRRSSRLRASVLDNIPGVGKKRKQILLTHFGSLKRIETATLDELEQVHGISKIIANVIYSRLHNNISSKSL